MLWKNLEKALTVGDGKCLQTESKRPFEGLAIIIFPNVRLAGSYPGFEAP